MLSFMALKIRKIKLENIKAIWERKMIIILKNIKIDNIYYYLIIVKIILIYLLL